MAFMSAQPVPIAEPLAVALGVWLPYRLDQPEGGREVPQTPWVFPDLTRSIRWAGGPTGHQPVDHGRSQRSICLRRVPFTVNAAGPIHGEWTDHPIRQRSHSR